MASSRTRLSNNRSVMPLDVLGRTRATLKGSACFPFPRGTGNPLNPLRGRDRGLQLFPVNQEFPVSTGHKPVLITSLPFGPSTIKQQLKLQGFSIDKNNGANPIEILVQTIMGG